MMTNQYFLRLTTALSENLRCDVTHRFWVFQDLKRYPSAICGRL